MPYVNYKRVERKNCFFALFFRIYGQTGSGKLKIWVPLESLCQAQSVGTLPNSVGALVEPQYCKTEKPFFRIYGQTGSRKRVKWVFLESSRQARSVDTPAIPNSVDALVEPK